MPIILYVGNSASVLRGISHRNSPTFLEQACYVDLLWSQADEGPFVDILFPRCPVCLTLIPYVAHPRSWLEHPEQVDDHSNTIGALRCCPCCCTIFIPEQSDLFSTLSSQNS